jgi:hypothetical protein
MKLADNEIRISYFALKVAKKQMEIELEKKKDISTTEIAEAEKELQQLNSLFNKVEVEYNKLLPINPFTHFPNVFFPEVL